MTISYFKPDSVDARFARTGAFLLLLCTMFLLPVPALAVVVDRLFEVEIPVPDESREIRNAALADGLAEILVRVSGDSGILQKLQPPSAGAYVKQFRYIAIETPQGGVVPEEDAVVATHRLWVQYNSTRIMELLRKQSIPIWSEHRSQAVIWFAVRDGVNQYVLRDQDTSLLKNSAGLAFERRGVPVIWPLNDSNDQQKSGFADVWAGFAGPLQLASKRYSSGPVIAASMSWNGRSWLADWSLFAGRESWRWSLEDADYNALIVRAIDLLSDTMGATFAVLEVTDSAMFEQVQVEIDGVKTVSDFRQVQDYLVSLSAVQTIWLARAEQERVAFRLKLRSNADDLLGLIRTDKRLLPVQSDDVAEQPVNSMVYHFRKNF